MVDENRNTVPDVHKKDDKIDTGRRAALGKLGLAVGIAYVAPVLLKLDSTAKAASSVPIFCPPGLGLPGCPDFPGQGNGNGNNHGG